MLWQRSSLGMTGAVSADEYEDIMFVIVLTNGITKNILRQTHNKKVDNL